MKGGGHPFAAGIIFSKLRSIRRTRVGVAEGLWHARAAASIIHECSIRIITDAIWIEPQSWSVATDTRSDPVRGQPARGRFQSPHQEGRGAGRGDGDRISGPLDRSSTRGRRTNPVLLLRFSRLNEVLQVDVDPTDVIDQPLIQNIDKTSGFPAIKTSCRVVLLESCDDRYEPGVRVPVLLGDGAVISLHAVFFEREMPACVLLEGLEKDAVNGPALPLVEGRPKIFRHLEQHPVLVIDSLNAGCECIGPFHYDSLLGPSKLRDRASGRCAGGAADGRGRARQCDQGKG